MDSLDFFRRNLKPIMAALTLMAMITFVFDDSMRAGNTTLVPIILAILFGGGAFVWGTRKGKQNEYLAMGALVGAVLGLIVMVFGERDTQEQPPIAGLKARDILNLKSRRETANRIVSLIFFKSHPIPEQFANNEMMRRFYNERVLGPQVQQYLFTLGRDDVEKDVIFGDLLRREAARLGITVNDDAVSDFIKMISDQKLSTQDFREIKQELHVGDHFIYDVLREEIAAAIAYNTTAPRFSVTPQQRWESFRKVNVKNSIEATTIPVEAFVKAVGDPSDEDLRSFFKKHAETFPTAKGDPGFRQPTRVKLAYLEADYEAIEAKVTPPTDEEVAEYYEKNKEFFIDRTPAKTEKKEDTTEGDDAKKPDVLSKEEERITAELDKQTEMDFTDVPLTDVVKFLADYHKIPMIIDVDALSKAGVATDTPVTRTLTDIKLRSALKIILEPLKLGYVIEDDVMKITTAEKVKEKEPPQADEKKDGDKPNEPKADKPKTEKPAEPEKPKTDKPADEPKKDTEKKSDSEGSACDDKAEESKKPDEPKKEDQKPDPEKSEKKEAPKADADKPEKKEDAKADDKKSDEKPKTDSKDDKPATEGKKKADSEKLEDTPDEKSEGKTEKKPELKYKPFEEVQDKIRDDLLRTRTLEEMKDRIEEAVKKMRRLGSYTGVPKSSKRDAPKAYDAELKELEKAPKYKSPDEVAAALKEIASTADLKYIQTPMLSAEELSKSEEFKIGSATDPMDDAMNRQGAVSVIQRVFGRGNDSVFSPEIAEDPGTKNRFAYWVTERDEAHVPKFDEEGIRDQVVKAWKLAKAAPEAEKRAKALAKAAEGKKLTEVLAGETVTGDKDGQALTVLAPEGKISHFTMSGMSAPGVNPFQGGNERLELSQIAGLEKLGDDFFSGIDKLKPGQTDALPNFDRSAFIVVHVAEREEIAAEEDAPQRTDFMKTWPGSPPANQLASFDFDPLRREWMQSIERKYNVKWPVK